MKRLSIGRKNNLTIVQVIALFALCTILNVSVIYVPVSSAKEDSSSSPISDRLSNELLYAEDSDLFDVMLWFNSTSKEEINAAIVKRFGQSESEWKKSLSDQSSLEEIREFKSLKAKVASEVYTRNNQVIVDKYLNKEELIYVSRYSPVALANLSKERINQIAKDEVISSIDLYFGNESIKCSSPDDEMKASRATMAKNAYGYDGSGIKVGIVDQSVPNLASTVGVYLPSGRSYNIDPNGIVAYGDSHAAHCGNILANVAEGAEFYFTGGEDALIDIEWLVDQGVDIISMSLSIGNGAYTNSYTDYSRWYDHISHQHYITMCLSAGNNGAKTTSPVSGVGASTGIHEAQMAYNVVTVGSLNFNGTPLNFGDDFIEPTCSYSSNSSYNAPFKPEISAPYGDTSSATPLVAGIVALMFEARSSLIAYPDAVKAILASSVNKDSPHKYLPKNRTTNLSTPSYMRYGAGVIDANAALQTVLGSDYVFYHMTQSSTSWTYEFTVSSTNTVRIALAFLQPADYSSSTHYPHTSVNSYTKADLDLYIVNASGGYYTFSTTRGNNVEIVEFTPPTAGTYTIKVNQYAASSVDDSVYFSVSWH